MSAVEVSELPASVARGPAGLRRAVSVALALGAAFGWATYYLFVLWVTPGTAAVAVLFYPFAAGGIVFTLWAVADGHVRAAGAAWRSPAAYVRVLLMVTMQLSVLAATYLAGPVDSSMLSLIGDVVATPLFAIALGFATRSTLARPLFAAGLLLSLGGGVLTIVGGQRLATVSGLGWIAVSAAPVAVGLYFLLAARAGESIPIGAVVGQATLAAALVILCLSPVLPGGVEGLLRVGARPLVLLAINGLVSFFLAPLAYFRAMAREGYVVPPMLMTAIPAFTLLLSAAVLRLPIALLAIAGIPVAIVGGVLILRAGSTTTSATTPAAGGTE